MQSSMVSILICVFSFNFYNFPVNHILLLSHFVILFKEIEND